MADEERRGYLRALDLAHAAEREIEAALGEAHRILMESARRHYSKMARRILSPPCARPRRRSRLSARKYSA